MVAFARYRLGTCKEVRSMDGSRFDAAVCSLGQIASRRSTLRGLLAGATALVTGSSTLTAGAQQRDCPRGRKRCKGKCIRNSRCCTNLGCNGDLKCVQNRCSCGEGKKPCGRNRCIRNSDDCPIRVTESSLRGWIRQSEDGPPRSSTEMATFVEGPGNPPRGKGSVKL